MNVDIAAFQQAFFDEAVELLDDFEAGLLQIEETPYDTELLNSIFRCAHSIKGGSATFGFPEIARFTHSLESLLDQVRKGDVAVSKPLCSVLLESLDHMRSLLAVAKGEASEAPTSDGLIARIQEAGNAVTEFEDSEVLEEGEGWGIISLPETYRLIFRPGADVLRGGNDPVVLLRGLSEFAEILEIECETASLPSLGELDLDHCYLGWTILLRTDAPASDIREHFEFIEDESLIELTVLHETGSAAAEQDAMSAVGIKTPPPATKAVAGKDIGTIKVSADKLDKLINLVGELVISQSMLNSVTESFDMSKLPRLMETVANMERASRELQERVMGIRLLQIKMAFGRFPRLVHDLASTCGKKIDLKLSGEETELDKNLIEAIGDPLTHLVRNSVDHGLETPQERIAAGKSETGYVAISAFHEGGSIIIEVSDDGKGLSKEKILAKAIERGLVSPDESISEDQIYNLIFQPGFSTAEKVTDLSGRGVGMDIVKQAINAIGGTIKVTSQPGRGVNTRIRLPLTMAILEGQSLAVGDEVYIVPLTAIVESIRPKPEDLHSIATFGEIVKVRGEVLPIIRLHEAFNIEPRVTNPCEASLVLVESEGRKVAILVDELLGQGQVVIKSLEANYRKVDCITGATILGDGRVALIIDVPGLIRQLGSTGSSLGTAA